MYEVILYCQKCKKPGKLNCMDDEFHFSFLYFIQRMVRMQTGIFDMNVSNSTTAWLA
jgi:hypothetical protein